MSARCNLPARFYMLTRVNVLALNRAWADNSPSINTE